MTRAWRFAIVFSSVLAGCGASLSTAARTDRLERLASGPLAAEVQRDAPEAYAEVARALTLARESRGRADHDARVDEAELTLEWAGTQAHAAVARRRATDANERARSLDAESERVEHQTQTLQQEIDDRLRAAQSATRAATAAQAINAVAAADRAAVASDLRQQASLFVAAAALLGAPEARRAPVDALIRAADEASRGTDIAAALVAAGRAYRAAEELVRVVRSEPTVSASGGTDATQLQHDVDGTDGVEPRQDVRGVLALMRGLFSSGATLAAASTTRIAAMARIIQGHGDARIRVESFVGGRDATAATRVAGAQAAAVVSALTRAGVPANRLESAGLHRTDGGVRVDDRVEIVLVLPH